MQDTAPEERWQRAQKILCIRLDAIGDVLMTTPAIKALKQADANRHITLLTSQSGADIAALVPEIDRVIAYDPPWMKATAPRLNSHPELEMVEALRQEAFDAAVIFTVFSQNPLPSAFLCYLAEIPLRLAHCHENPYQLLTHWVLDPEPSAGIRHEVRRQLDLVANVGFHLDDECLSLQAPDLSYQRIFSHLNRLGLDVKQPWVVIHPGATAPSRRYPAEGFAAIARLLRDAHCQVVFTGTEPEQELVDGIQAAMAMDSYSLVGELALAEMVALLAIAPLLLTNNSGPAHIAAAVGTPVVDLYALTNPQHTPWGVPNRVLFHDVPCKFCYKSLCPEGHHDCLRLVTPDAVFQAIGELLHPDPLHPEASSLIPSPLLTAPLTIAPTQRSTSNVVQSTVVQSAKGVWQ